MEYQQNARRKFDPVTEIEKQELWFANDDIPMNILSRLSTKTLLSFKCVSKPWNNLISDRTFIFHQLKKTEPISGFFFQSMYQWSNNDMDSVNYIPIEKNIIKLNQTVLKFFPESIVILSSSHGLLCCRSFFPSSDPVIYICNPLKKEWISVPWPNPGQGRNLNLVLAFDPFNNPINQSTMFKIVSVSRTGDFQLRFNLYSSETKIWSGSEEICRCKHVLVKNKGIFVNGICYWLTDGDEILSFDVENERSWLIKVPLPAMELSMVTQFCVGESEGNVYYVLLSEYGLQLWVLEDYFGSQWKVKYCVGLDELEKENSEFVYHLAEKWLHRRNGDVPWVDPLCFKDEILLMRVSMDIYSFDFETRKMRKLCNIEDLKPPSFSSIIVPYTMSLVPLN